MCARGLLGARDQVFALLPVPAPVSSLKWRIFFLLGSC
jgi:hypothetical protein